MRTIAGTLLAQISVIVFLLTTALPCEATPLQPGSVKLPVKAALVMAISNNLDLRVDDLNTSLAAADLHGSKSIYDPSLSLSVNRGETFYTGETYGTKDATGAIGLTQNLPSGGSVSLTTRSGYTKPVSDFPDDNWTDWYTSVGMTLYQPLLKRFGKESTEINISLAQLGHEASLEEFREAVSATVYSVIKSYNRLYTLRQALAGKAEALKSARELRIRLSSRTVSEAADTVELANTEYVISQRLKALVDAERAIKDQQAKLRYLIGVEDKTDLIPVDAPSRREPSETLEEAITLALENHPDLKQRQLDVDADALRERVAKRQLLPNLAITASAGLRGLDDRFSDSVDQISDGKGRWWSAGLQFSIPLGNTAAEANYRIRKLRHRQGERRLEASRWKIRNYIEADMRALVSARVQIQVAEKAVESARRRLDRYRLLLDQGRANVQDFLDAESDLEYTRNSQTQALETFANAVALFWKDCGVLLERENVNIRTTSPEKLTGQDLTLSVPEMLPEASNIARRQKAQDSKDSNHQATATLSDRTTTGKPASHEETHSDATANHDTAPPAKNAVGETGSAPMKTRDEPVRYNLNIGEFGAADLEKARKRIRSVGLTAVDNKGGHVTQHVIRLVIDDFPTLADANEVSARLADTGAGCFILPHGNSNFRLYAGSFFNRDSATEEVRRLAKKGLTLRLEEVDIKLPATLLISGPFKSATLARQSAKKLERAGFHPVIVETKL